MSLISPIPVELSLPKRFLRSPGGFAWWYLDVVNDQGDGVVLIWSFGLPFLPGYANSTRQNNPPPPSSRPSLNVAIYRSGKPAFYLLQEYEPGDAHWRDDRRFVFGNSFFDIDLNGRDGRANAVIDVAVPGGDRLKGAIQVRGSVPEIAASDHEPEHYWGPLIVPGEADVSLECGGDSYNFTGDAYVDRNGAATPLHDLGFSKWTWGRVRVGSVEKVYYVLWPQTGGEPTAIGFEFSNGKTERIDLRSTFIAPEVGFAGMPWFRSFKFFKKDRVWLEGTSTALLDNGPFYIRGQFVAMDDGAGSTGVFEWCEPDRIDLSRHRFLVNMRVGNPKKNSIWLPLFSGPSRGRVDRLLKSWLRR